MVSADGEIVAAGPDGDPELLWALRGGGGNFGVVTRFDFRLTSVTSFFGGHIGYPMSATRDVLERVEAIIATGPASFAPFLGIGLNEETRQPNLTVGFGMAAESGAAEAAIAPLRRDLPVLLDDAGPRTYLDIQAMSGTLPFGLRHYWKGHFITSIDADLIVELGESVARQPIHDAFMLVEAISGAARVEPAGGAAFGQRAAHWNATTLAIWESPDDDAAAIDWARRTTAIVEPRSLSGAGYANYAPFDETADRVRASFGDERFARLGAVKRRYDPDNVFRFNLNIPPGG
jgi:FAD/FMN-containing dehydrogenase